MQKFKHKIKSIGASVALAATLVGGAATLSTQAAAQPTDPANQSTGLGNALIYPYYTVLDGWQTLFNVTNTSDSAVAIKIRLHEAQNSRDVLDFIVLLSPKDMWSASLTNDGSGRAMLTTNDRSCTVPLVVRDSGVSTSEIAYEGDFSDYGSHTTDRMSEGYIEILTMGEALPGTFGTGGLAPHGVTHGAPYASIHVDGEPRDCAALQGDFVSTVNDWSATNVPGSGSPNAGLGAPAWQYGAITSTALLKGNVSYINAARGLAAGSEAVAIPSYGVGAPENVPVGGTPGAAMLATLMTAQQFPYFLEPTLGSSQMGIWSPDYTHVEAYLATYGLVNEWSNNGALGAQTDWVITFPTKGGHVDYITGADPLDAHIQAGCNPWRFDGTTVNPTAANAITGDGPSNHCYSASGAMPALEPFEKQFTANASAITVQYDVYDREEGTATVVADGVTVSPAPPPDVIINALAFEANVLVVGNSSHGALTSVLSSANALTLDTNVLTSDSKNGFLEIRFPEADQGETMADDNLLPVSGFIFKSRDFGDAALSYGQLMKHSPIMTAPAP